MFRCVRALLSVCNYFKDDFKDSPDKQVVHMSSLWLRKS